jgi:Spy/CpxP family protein refolding chaperone
MGGRRQRMKQKILIIALVASVALNVGALATFAYRRATMPKPPGPPCPLARTLDLTDEQREAMRARRERTFEEMKPLRRQLHAKRGEVLELLKEPEVDAVRRDKLFAEIADLQMRLELRAFENMYETRRLLRPEQQKRFMKLVEERFRHRRKHFARGRVHRPGGHGFEHKMKRERGSGE